MRGDDASIAEIPHPLAITSDLTVAESAEWYACGRPPRESQGWKIYVPFTLANAGAILTAALPLIQAYGLHCKYVRAVKLLRKLNTGMFGHTQIGKNLVVYLPRVNRSFLNAMKSTLEPFRDQCPAVPNALPFGGDLPLYYRYGAYRDAFLRFEGGEYPDDRSTPIPKGVRNRLARFTQPIADDPAVTAFLLRFPVFQAIVQQGKGGIFRALNLESESFQEAVLKVGNHRGQVQPDGSDGCAFLRREIGFYKLLAERGLAHLAPALFSHLDRPRKVIIALEFVPGSSLLAQKLSGSLTVRHLDRCWEIMSQIHSAGLYLGDAKLANFIATESGDVRVLDFEAAGTIGDHAAEIRTFVVTPESADPVHADRAHFLASVLFPYEEGRYSWADRQVDLRGWLQTDRSDQFSAWMRPKIKDVLREAPARCSRATQ